MTHFCEKKSNLTSYLKLEQEPFLEIMYNPALNLLLGFEKNGMKNFTKRVVSFQCYNVEFSCYYKTKKWYKENVHESSGTKILAINCVYR